MYSIDYDRTHRLLRLRIAGFWDAATTQAFVRDIAAASEKARARGAFRVLSDAREFAVQTPEVAERFARLAESGAAERTAILVTSALARMQAQRAMAGERVRIFADEAEALAWLEVPPA